MNSEKVKRNQRGRPISFDKNQLVDAVMHKFWEHGYAKVSLNEIAKENGLTRASLYHSFDSKETLFMLALERYLEESPDALLDQIHKPDHVGDVLYELLENICSARAADGQKRGCLICNCVDELIAEDNPLGDRVRTLISSRHQRIGDLLQHALITKELPAESNIHLLTNMFINFLFGLNTFSKTTSSEMELRQLCDGFLTSLGFSRKSALSQQAC